MPLDKNSAARSTRTKYVVQAGIIAAVYAVATILAMVFLGNFAWGPIQFRISEALTVLAALSPSAIPGLTVGCLIANLFNLSAAGALGILDVVFGSLATLLAAVWTWTFRSRPAVALLGPVITNAIIVPAYLPLILKGIGFYTIPFTTISMESGYIAMYLFGFASVAVGQAAVVYGLGFPLLAVLKRSLPNLLGVEEGTNI